MSTQREVKFLFGHGADGLAGVVRLGANFQVAFVVNQLRQSGAHHRMIVHDQQAFGGKFGFWRP